MNRARLLIAVADGGRQGEVRHDGTIAGDIEALTKVVRALSAPNRVLHFVYEAGPSGFGIHRHLTALGHDCVVVSPSMIPKRSGDRVKTDRRDGVSLARLHRAGELRAIHIPDAPDEAMRDLVRAREGRGGRRHPGEVPIEGVSPPPGTTVSRARRLDDSVSAVVGWALVHQPGAAHRVQEYRDTIDETERRVDRLTEQR